MYLEALHFILGITTGSLLYHHIRGPDWKVFVNVAIDRAVVILLFVLVTSMF
jgi:hypothetical protein